MPGPARQRLRFNGDWKASVLALLFLPLLLSLGFWQLDRAEEKRQLQALFEQRQLAGHVPITQIDSSADLRYQPVELVGEYINAKTLFLDNRIYQGQFGYEIITPFKLAGSNTWVLINRGWLKGDVARRQLPVVAAVNNTVKLRGEIYVPQGELMRLADEPITVWPQVVQSIDSKVLAEVAAEPLFPYTVRLDQNSPGYFQKNWLVVNQQPDKHIGYAVQWFAMSFMVLVILFLANTNCWALLKSRKTTNKQEN